MRFQEKLRKWADNYVYGVYNISKDFPKHELFNITSQIRRASLSVTLNIIEGWARRSNKSFLLFQDISYSSLQESQYLLGFAYKLGYISDQKNYLVIKDLGDQIGALLWSSLERSNPKRHKNF